jgi:hypothetical protein
MKINNLSWVLPLFLAVSCSQTPKLNATPTASSNILGTVALGIGTNAGSSSVHFSPRAAIADNAVTFGTPIFSQDVDGSGTRYLSAIFPITNSGVARTNLTLYAYNKGGVSVGGTAIQNLINFTGGSSDSNAQSLLPIHKTDLVLGVPTIDANNADFQGFTQDDIATLTAEALALVPPTIAAADTVLQYGFVARNSTGGRTIAAGGTGTVTIAYQLPDANVASAYKFVANFVLAEDDPLNVNTRVTRGLGETSSAAEARALALGAGVADEVYFSGTDNDEAVSPTLTTTRTWNLLIGKSPTCLLSNSCNINPIVDISANSPTAFFPAPAYTLNIIYEAAAGTSVTDITVDWGDGTAADSFNGGTLTASPLTAIHSFPGVTAVGTPNTINVDLTDSSTTVTTTTLDVDVI